MRKKHPHTDTTKGGMKVSKLKLASAVTDAIHEHITANEHSGFGKRMAKVQDLVDKGAQLRHAINPADYAGRRLNDDHWSCLKDGASHADFAQYPINVCYDDAINAHAPEVNTT